MNTLRISQAWVDRVTSSNEEDLTVVGPAPLAVPSEAEVNEVFRRLSSSNAGREMARRGWFNLAAAKDRVDARFEAIRWFLLAEYPHRPALAGATLFRQHYRSRDFVDELATMAWIFRVADKAVNLDVPAFDAAALDHKELSRLARTSVQSLGPRVAVSRLSELGIRVVTESGLPGMRADGASFFLSNGKPVIALTLRFDRLDSFWFTLLHELGHIVLHLRAKVSEVFVDSTTDNPDSDLGDEKEAEADAFAKDAFMPRDLWTRSEAFRLGTEAAICDLAKKCHIHPAIVAGRLRYERKNFTVHSRMLGEGEVRKLLMDG